MSPSPQKITIEQDTAPIVLVGPAHPFRGGIAQFTTHLFQQLSATHRVELISFSRQYPSLLFPGRTQFDESKTALQVPASSMLDSISPLSWLKTAAHIVKLQPRAVVFMQWTSFFAPAYGTIVRRIKARLEARIVFLCHNLFPHEPSPLDRMLTRYGLSGVEGILALSEAVARDARKFLPNAAIRRGHLPVMEMFPPLPSAAEARRKFGIAPDELSLLFFGHIRAYKGLSFLLRAMPLILKKRTCRLLIAGEFYEPKNQYERLIRELKIDAAVSIVDRYLPNEEVPEVFAAADLCILPYVSATQSGVAKVAYGFDKPVIITNVGGLAEEVVDGETGYVVPPQSPEALAAAVERFCGDRQNHDFVTAVKKFRERFSWETLLGALEELMAIK